MQNYGDFAKPHIEYFFENMDKFTMQKIPYRSKASIGEY